MLTDFEFGISHFRVWVGSHVVNGIVALSTAV